MIRRKEDHIRFDKQIAGGPGLAHATQLLNEGEFYDKGRLFNIVRLGPGDAVGRHQHVGDMEVYHILNTAQIVHSRHRSVANFIINIISALGAYCFFDNNIKAYRIQDKARNVGFDWNEKEDVWDKVQEELEELKVELAKGAPMHWITRAC